MGRFLTKLPRLARQLRELAQRVQPDLVYINGPRLLPAAALARLRQPVLFHAHIEVSQRAARVLAGRSLARLNARVIAVCRGVADAWRPFAGATVVYNGVAHPDRSLTVVAPKEVPLIGCIGRIAPEKGQLEFVEAASRIHQALPHARFLICGAPLFSDRAAVSYERRVREAASSLQVEFTGWVSDVYPVMRHLDLLLVPSVWNEPNPRVVLEAFAAKLPVIAFRAGGLPEIVDHGRTGFLCSSAREMADLAISLFENGRERLHGVAEAAHESWRTQFSLERWQQQMLAEIERAANAA
jgi:glycosyltransferase involved in cell wall biosynthesis